MNKKVRISGTAVPLGALRTKTSPVIGEYDSLIPFSKFCKKAGLSAIQLLPVLDTGLQSSPYSSLSAFALHPLYINVTRLKGFKDLYEKDEDYRSAYDDFLSHSNDRRYNYDYVYNQKIYLLWRLFDHLNIGSSILKDKDFNKWFKQNPWLKNYCVYKRLKFKYMQASWKSWPEKDRYITEEKINQYWNDPEYLPGICFCLWNQYNAHLQFEQACKKVKEEGILLKGDLPILINEDSCDAWASSDIFNENLKAGSPPDYENPYGQSWGFPVYDWQSMKKDGYKWWSDRVSTAGQYFDAFRLDHILGFFRLWAIPEGEETAELGHNEPYAALSANTLIKNGFSKERIKWLSIPHIPTRAIEDITHNYDAACSILSVFCTRIDNEELWLFKKNITSAYSIRSQFFNYSPQDESRLIDTLVRWWNNRTLINIAKDKYVPAWNHTSTQGWQSLSEDERKTLSSLFGQLSVKQEKLWKSNADDIFTAILSKTKMIPCAEDLGISLECLPSVLKKHNIMSLNVIRWNRMWNENNQPYAPFSAHNTASVAVTSVHDSSTLRQWWNTEKDSVAQFIALDKELSDQEAQSLKNSSFNEDIAEYVLKKCARTESMWFINPIQDWLFLSKKYYAVSDTEERINIPGSVSDFNWTYRLPSDIEELTEDNDLTDKIINVVKMHD